MGEGNKLGGQLDNRCYAEKETSSHADKKVKCK